MSFLVPRFFRVQAVVLRVGDRRREEGQRQPSEGGETIAGSAQHASQGGVEQRAFAAGSVNSEHQDAARHSYPLLTADGVWVGEVGVEGSATYIPQVREHLRRRRVEVCCRILV